MCTQNERGKFEVGNKRGERGRGNSGRKELWRQGGKGRDFPSSLSSNYETNEFCCCEPFAYVRPRNMPKEARVLRTPSHTGIALCGDHDKRGSLKREREIPSQTGSGLFLLRLSFSFALRGRRRRRSFLPRDDPMVASSETY